MRRYYRTRTTYAQNHRVTAPRYGGVRSTFEGEGVQSQTCDGKAQGFTAPVVERRRADSTPVFFVESERFTGRYYFLFQQSDGTWKFSGDSKLLQHYVARVQAYLASTSELQGVA